jgi:hypothetical protein
MSEAPLDVTMFRAPAIMLSGPVDYAMYTSFRNQLMNASQEGLIVVELSTLGGDPEVARMGCERPQAIPLSPRLRRYPRCRQI